jgi:hypothetical protein
MPSHDPFVEGESGSASILAPVLIDGESYTMVVDDELLASRSNSFVNTQEETSANLAGRSRRKEKGKAKEKTEPSDVRVKEEPRSISLHSPEPSNSVVRQFQCILYPH